MLALASLTASDALPTSGEVGAAPEPDPPAARLGEEVVVPPPGEVVEVVVVPVEPSTTISYMV